MVRLGDVWLGISGFGLAWRLGVVWYGMVWRYDVKRRKGGREGVVSYPPRRRGWGHGRCGCEIGFGYEAELRHKVELGAEERGS